MLIAKVRQRTARGKLAGTYDHFVAIEWSLKTLAIAHVSPREPPRLPGFAHGAEPLILIGIRARRR